MQTKGSKLFILFHPDTDLDAFSSDDTDDGEKNQSRVDPLKFIPVKAKIFGMYAVVLKPGEAIYVPRKWWYYAVSLERSQTVMRNWYNSKTNMNTLVKMILKPASGGGGSSFFNR